MGTAQKITGAVLTTVIGILLLIAISPNTYMLGYRKEQLPQYQFSEIITRTKEATLLNYGFLDGGFYTVSGGGFTGISCFSVHC